VHFNSGLVVDLLGEQVELLCGGSDVQRRLFAVGAYIRSLVQRRGYFDLERGSLLVPVRVLSRGGSRLLLTLL